MKDVELGLYEKNKMDKNPKSQGMDTAKRDQKPLPTPREKVSKNGKSFTIC